MYLYSLQFANDQVVAAKRQGRSTIYRAQKLQEEFKNWGLEINTQKNKILANFGADTSNVSLENEEKQVCGECTYFGVTFDVTDNDDGES